MNAHDAQPTPDEFELKAKAALIIAQEMNQPLNIILKNIMHWHNRSLQAAKIELLNKIYELSPTKQFKDWTAGDALAFYERLKVLEAELEQREGK